MNTGLGKWSFWLFFAGIYKSDGLDYEFYITFFALTIGCIFERKSINWLRNRWGCSYYRLQKYIELDNRRDALGRAGRKTKGQWDRPNPAYDVERYRKHYFYADFDYLKEKFQTQC